MNSWLKYYGFSEHVMPWYVTIYQIGIVFNDRLALGLPQESVFGPLLFALCTNNFPSIVDYRFVC